jgi:hypothetical protein
MSGYAKYNKNFPYFLWNLSENENEFNIHIYIYIYIYMYVIYDWTEHLFIKIFIDTNTYLKF